MGRRPIEGTALKPVYDLWHASNECVRDSLVRSPSQTTLLLGQLMPLYVRATEAVREAVQGRL